MTAHGVDVTLRFDEGAWTGAWLALYAQLGGGELDTSAAGA